MWDKYLWWGGKPNGDAGEMLIVVKNLQLKADYEDDVVANHNVDERGPLHREPKTPAIYWLATLSCTVRLISRSGAEIFV